MNGGDNLIDANGMVGGVGVHCEREAWDGAFWSHSTDVNTTDVTSGISNIFMVVNSVRGQIQPRCTMRRKERKRPTISFTSGW